MDTPLILHIISGFTALACGTLSMIFKKGSLFHRNSGKVFHLAMHGVVLSALWISVSKWNVFLMTIAVFAFYQNIGGWRSIKNKSLKPSLSDYLLMIVGFANGVIMVSTSNVVLLVFGTIQLLLVVSDVRLYFKLYKKVALPPLAWLQRHIGMMMGAYIATITAFLVTNFRNVEPGWLLWLAPTFILVPLMQYWTRKYAKRTA